MEDLSPEFDGILEQWRSGAIDDAAAAVQLMLIAALQENPEEAIRQLMDSAPPRIIAAMEQAAQTGVKVEKVEEWAIFRWKHT
jgi:hypothetical protein